MLLTKDLSMPDSASIQSDSTTVSSLHNRLLRDGGVCCCNACPHCADVCGNEDCDSCREKSALQSLSAAAAAAAASQKTKYTMCQVRRHNHADSAWIVANGVIYDATAYLSVHPGGADCILRKAGGAKDCTEDLQFHSRNGRKKWERCRLGTIQKCSGGEQDAKKKKKNKECRWWQLGTAQNLEQS